MSIDLAEHFNAATFRITADIPGHQEFGCHIKIDMAMFNEASFHMALNGLSHKLWKFYKDKHEQVSTNQKQSYN